MKKIIIIGCPGSGKTTFAEKLQIATNLPLYYLDAIWHKTDKTHISREEYDSILAEIFQTEEWIIDGNYSRTIEERMQNSDTIFLFDLPTEVCLQGATERLGKERYDMPWIDTVLDLKLKQEIEAFPDKMLPMLFPYMHCFEKQQMQKTPIGTIIMLLVMNGMFVFMIPSGVGLYYFVSSLFTVVEQVIFLTFPH